MLIFLIALFLLILVLANDAARHLLSTLLAWVVFLAFAVLGLAITIGTVWILRGLL